MDEIVNTAAVGMILKILVIATFLLIFWMLEAIWQHDKRWLLPIFIFPPTIIVAVTYAWEIARARCIFAGIYLALVVFISGVVQYNFLKQLGILLLDLSIWPYYLLKYLLQIV